MHPFHPHHPMYTGAPMFSAAPFPGPMMGHHHAGHHGFCHSCCHPHSHCMCHHRECRKEAKELVVSAASVLKPKEDAKFHKAALNFLRATTEGLATNPIAGAEAAAAVESKAGLAGAFIGGGCCVHLSVEYMADNPAAAAAVWILVVDSEGTWLAWARNEPPGTPYRIKEDIITTKPGAKLLVAVNNATARVRWCEIFSC